MSGGDPGHPGLYGPIAAPESQRPSCLAVLETEGWQRLDSKSRKAFEGFLGQLQDQGVRILRRADNPLLELLEQSVQDATTKSMRLISWEQRWSLENLIEQHPGTLGPSLLDQLDNGRDMTLQSYRQHILLRENARRCLSALATQCDALISLSSCGPAPRFEDTRNTKFPTGDVSFSCVSSYLGAPAVSAPALAVDGLPLGVQVIGQHHEDYKITAIATWLQHAVV